MGSEGGVGLGDVGGGVDMINTLYEMMLTCATHSTYSSFLKYRSTCKQRVVQAT